MSKPVEPLSDLLKFEISSASFDVKEAFERWRLGIVRRVRREQARAARDYVPADHDHCMAELRDEWCLWKHCYRIAAKVVRP